MNSLIHTFPFHEFNSLNELPDTDKELVNQSFKAAQKAYAPYSNFKVGAALRLVNGTVVDGSNQENASYPEGLCAERVTLNAAAHQHPTIAGETLAICAFKNGVLIKDAISPCGGCRQVMLEYMQRHNHPLRIILAGSEKIIVLENARYLLPFSFGKSDLA